MIHTNETKANISSKKRAYYSDPKNRARASLLKKQWWAQFSEEERREMMADWGYKRPHINATNATAAEAVRLLRSGKAKSQAEASRMVGQPKWFLHCWLKRKGIKI